MSRIVFTVTNDLSYDQRMDRICSTLALNGFDVLLVGRRRKKSISLEKRPYKQARMPMFFSEGKLFYLEYNFRLFFKLLFTRTDIICAIDLDTILPCYWVAKLRRKKQVYDAHEYFTEVIEVVGRPMVKKMWKLLERSIVPKLTFAYTVNESLKQLYEKEYDVSFEVIRNMSSLREKEVAKDIEDPYIVYAGAVNEGRGLDECIEAMQFLDCKLMICGDGDIMERLRDKVQALSLSEKVVFTGYLTPKELTKKINNAWLGVLLLENKGLSYYYSLANKFFDYIHAGIPQLTVGFPEYRILNAKHEVALLTPLDPSEIAKNVKRLLDDKELYDKLASNTLLARKEWNWQNEAKKLVDFYKKVDQANM
ncbi:glycosyltransferase [Cytophagaceae bacterium ABcell3]|nr:glycosyltransferase [Cytophagaceae bacterium ABcell3]